MVGMEKRLELYNFCHEYIRLCELHHNLYDLEIIEKYEKKIDEELSTIENCMVDELYEILETRGKS